MLSARTAGSVQTRYVSSKGQLKEQAGSLVSKCLTLPFSQKKGEITVDEVGLWVPAGGAVKGE